MNRVAGHSGLWKWTDERSIVGTTTVETVRIDDVLAGRSVDVIKMDIEGNEPAALRGMENTLARSPDARLFVELSPGALQAAGVSPESFKATLNAAFREVSMIDERNASLRPFTLDESDRLCNLYCRGLARSTR
jgi:hypothetical protein